MNICVLSEVPINQSDIPIEVRIVGGLLIENGCLVDDTIIAVIKEDSIWSDVRDVKELPVKLVEQLKQYFLTNKMKIGKMESTVEINQVYGLENARKVLEASINNYNK